MAERTLSAAPPRSILKPSKDASTRSSLSSSTKTSIPISTSTTTTTTNRNTRSSSPSPSTWSGIKDLTETERDNASIASAETPRAVSAWSASTSALNVFVAGVFDSLSIHHALLLLVRSSTVQRKALQCLVLNGLLFLGSILLFDRIVRPFVVAWIDNPSYQGEGQAIVALFITALIVFVQYVFWLVPVYVISFVLNNIWYQDIATIAYQSRYQKIPVVPVNSSLISDEIFRMLLLPCYVLQVLALYMIPIFGQLMSFVCFSWLCSFYSFDYKWAIKGAPLVNRIRYFEEHWSYMAGFGTPCALATFFTDTFISSGTYALIFPILIITANSAKPKKQSSDDIFSPRVPIFQLSKIVVDRVITLLNRRAFR
eukprot:TRINITY_DN5775_c0_g1_i3.p1 TRINITY_DN5775_c0_g1~~TRINITY_DN5775_c0_g1_i3.p1  ORF type:complete len:370 (+),score=67.52 TRINITY_DN5775_c0_g1_i3:71-1180(+)